VRRRLTDLSLREGRRVLFLRVESSRVERREKLGAAAVGRKEGRKEDKDKDKERGEA